MERIENYRLTLFGDSISKGAFYAENRFQLIKESAVKLIGEHFNVQIENNSMIGQTLKRIYDKRLINAYVDALNKNKNNCVILSIGGNDSDFDWKSVANSPLAFHESKTPLIEFERILDESVEMLIRNNVKVVFTTLTPVDSIRFFNTIIAKTADCEKVLEFFRGDLSNISRHQECYNNAVIKCAVKHGCRILDTRTGFLMKTNYLDFFGDDGIHPNELGQREIANEVINQISLF